MGIYLLSLATSIVGGLVFGLILFWWHKLLERRLPEGTGRAGWRSVAPSAVAFGTFLFARDVLMRTGTAEGFIGFLWSLGIGLLVGAVVTVSLRDTARRG